MNENPFREVAEIAGRQALKPVLYRVSNVALIRAQGMAEFVAPLTSPHLPKTVDGAIYGLPVYLSPQLGGEIIELVCVDGSVVTAEFDALIYEK